MNNVTPEFVSEWVAEDSEVPYTDLSKDQLAHAYLDAWASIERLRGELARRDEQIAAVRALATEWRRTWAAYADQITDPTDVGELRVAHRSQKVCAGQLLAALDGAS